jgi:hypothetical protein
MPGTNTLSYYVHLPITAVKSFMTLGSGSSAAQGSAQADLPLPASPRKPDWHHFRFHQRQRALPEDRRVLRLSANRGEENTFGEH